METVALDGDLADDGWESIDARYDFPSTPSSSNDSPPPPPSFAHTREVLEPDTDDEDDDDGARGRGELIPRVKPGGYDSRTEQLLYENPELPILITDAGKSVESGGRYIVYTIRTGVCCPGAPTFLRSCCSESLVLTVSRIWKFVADTLNLHPYERPLPGCTRLW